MSKKKKKLGEWGGFVNNLLNRKRAKRPVTLPRDYLMAIADDLHRTNPNKEIIYNTLVDLYWHTFDKGYKRRISDARFFREKQEKAFQREWKEQKDLIDDTIHNKNNQ